MVNASAGERSSTERIRTANCRPPPAVRTPLFRSEFPHHADGPLRTESSSSDAAASSSWRRFLNVASAAIRSGFGAESLRCGCHTNGSCRASMTSSISMSIRLTYGKVARRKRGVQHFLPSGTYRFLGHLRGWGTKSSRLEPVRAVVADEPCEYPAPVRRGRHRRGVSLLVDGGNPEVADHLEVEDGRGLFGRFVELVRDDVGESMHRGLQRQHAQRRQPRLLGDRMAEEEDELLECRQPQ